MEITVSEKRIRRASRARRTRKQIRQDAALFRLSVFRSGQHIYAQIIDDVAGKTVVFAHDVVKKGKEKKKRLPIDKAKEVGEAIAKKALEKNIAAVVFDRGGYKYHGRVRALADAARKAGLKF